MKPTVSADAQIPVWLLVVLAHPLQSGGQSYARWYAYSVEVDHAARAMRAASPKLYAHIVLDPNVQVAQVAKHLRQAGFPTSRVWVLPKDLVWTPRGGQAVLARFVEEQRAFPTLTQHISRARSASV